MVATALQGYVVCILLFTSHVPVFLWSSRHNLRDIELKFCFYHDLHSLPLINPQIVFYHDLHTANYPPNLNTLA